MRNGEYKIYKGMKIIKVNGTCFKVKTRTFTTYDKAKREIDCIYAEEKALADNDEYVKTVCGGWL